MKIVWKWMAGLALLAGISSCRTAACGCPMAEERCPSEMQDSRLGPEAQPAVLFIVA